MSLARHIGVLVAVMGLIGLSGCPNGSIGTFDVYVINATKGLTIGLVGLDNHKEKALVDVLDENIPPDTMKVLKVSQATYGDDSGSVQIGVVNVGFTQATGVPLGPDPVVILVEGTNSAITARALSFQ